MTDKTQYIFPFSRAMYDAQGNVVSGSGIWDASLGQAQPNLQPLIYTTAYGTKAIKPVNAASVVATDNEVIAHTFALSALTVTTGGVVIHLGNDIVKELQMAKLAHVTDYLKKGGSLYSIGSVITGVGGMYNHWAHPEYYHNDPDRGTEGDPHPILSIARKWASVGKHFTTVMEGLGNTKIPGLTKFGHVVDGANLLLQGTNLIDSITNDSRTGKDVTIAAFSTASTVFANASNTLTYSPAIKTKEGVVAMVGLKALALSMTSISNMLEDPTIWGRLKEEVQSGQFWEGVRDYGYHLIVDEVPGAIESLGDAVKDSVTGSLPLVGDMFSPAATVTEDQEQLALKEWYKKNYPKTYQEMYEPDNAGGTGTGTGTGTGDIVELTPTGRKIPVLQPDGVKIPVLQPTPKIPVLSGSSKRDPYAGLSMEELKALAKAGKLKQNVLVKMDSVDDQDLPNVNDLLSKDESLDHLLGGTMLTASINNQASQPQYFNQASELLKQLSLSYDI